MTRPNLSREEQIKNLVRSCYEDPTVVARYTSLELWPSEETLILDHVPDEARILDLGCGAGRTTIPMAEMGLEVVGVDISRTMVDLAAQQAQLVGQPIGLAVMDAMTLGFADGSFDVAVYSYNGLELIPGREGKRVVIAEIGRVLRSGGCFIFSSHSLFALNRFAPLRLLSFLKLCAGRVAGVPVRELELGERFADEEDEEVKYLQVLPPSVLKRMLRQCGFRLVRFNTRRRIETNRRFRFPGHFEDGERFYVARKT